MAETIEYYYSYLSPFAYLGFDLFLKLADKYQFNIKYRPMKLMQVFENTGGVPLAKRHPSRVAIRNMDLKRWREKRKVPVTLQPKYFPINPELADCAGISILNLGGDIQLYSSLAHKAIWTDDKDISDETVVIDLIQAAGHHPQQVLDGLEAARQVYEDNTNLAIKSNVFGSPTYILNGELFFGQDRIELLEDALSSGRPPYSSDLSES